MPRPKDHRDVTINTLVSPVPRKTWAQFTVQFDSFTDLGQSSSSRVVASDVIRDESLHEARIVDGTRVIGTVRWERIVQCNVHASRPELVVTVDDWDPRGSGAPTLPSRAPDRDAIWDEKPEVTCQLQMWVDAEQGFTATISSSEDPPYTIDFRDSTTGRTHSFTLDARLGLFTPVLSRRLGAVCGLPREPLP